MAACRGHRDALGHWLDECCETGANHIEATSALFASWKVWAEASGEFVGSIERFSRTLTTRGLAPHRSSTIRSFIGLRLREPIGSMPSSNSMEF